MQLMKVLKIFFYQAIILLTIVSCSKSVMDDSLKILFIGNSYTYYNSSPELFKALVNERFPNKTVNIQLVSQGGMTLKRHWEDGRALEAIKSNTWDYVILQEQSKLGMGIIIDDDFYFGQTEHFYEYARKFDAEIKKSGAKTAFFMTWSVKQKPEEQVILTHAYSTIAKELNAILIPVGLVWDNVRTKNQFNLYNMDGSHPSAYGSYLVATSVFSSLLDEDPSGLTGVISGLKLSSRGVPDLASQPLVNINKTDALAIQKVSWEVVDSIRDSGGYPTIAKPEQNYTLPRLPEGETINYEDISGRWYGTSTYSSSYLGLIMDVEHVNNDVNVNVSFYTPDRRDHFFIRDAQLKEKTLEMIVIDSLRTMTSNLSFSLNDSQLNGISESFGGNIINYKHWKLSRKLQQNDLDIEAVDLLMQRFENETETYGFVNAAIKHYKRYGALVNEDYIPEEMYLNATGYNLVQDGKINDALGVFELAMTLYPESVNTYDSYGETLVKAGELDKGIMIYTQGYELAKKTSHANIAYMAANLKKFTSGHTASQETPPPPPPAQ